MVPNPDYQGEKVLQNGGVTLIFYTDFEAAYTDLLADNLDVLDQLPANALGSYETDLGDRAIKQPYAGTTTLAIPVSLAHLGMDDEGRLRRQAISMAIDRETIISAIFNGTRTPAKDFTSPGLTGYSDSLPGNEVLTYNAEQAKALWARGRCDQPVVLAASSSPTTPTAAHKEWIEPRRTASRTCWASTRSAEADTPSSVTTHPGRGRTISARLPHRLAGRLPVGVQLPRPLYATGAGSNDAKYSNPEFDQLLDEGCRGARRRRRRRELPGGAVDPVRRISRPSLSGTPRPPAATPARSAT